MTLHRATSVNEAIDGPRLTDSEEVAAWHEEQRDYHMVLARGFRDDLDRLRMEDPEEYALWDRIETIGAQARAARWHNRAAWVTRWHERTRPKQAWLFGDQP